MIILDATTKSLEIKLGGAITTTQLPFVTSYVDITTNTFTPIEADGASNNTSAITVMAAPAASTQRQLKSLSIYNADTAAATVTLQYNDNSTTRIIIKIILSVGDSLIYTDTEGFSVITNTGSIKTGTGTSVQMGSVFIQVPTNITIALISYAEYAFTIYGLNNLKTASGSITAAIQINGTNVTSLSALSVTSTPQSPTASAANSVVIGDRVTLVLSANSSSTNLEFTLKGTV